MEKAYHIPVLLNEVINGLKIKPNGVYLDLTLGGAGHSSEIAKKLSNGILIGFDKDLEAISESTKKLSKTIKISTGGLPRQGEALLVNKDFKLAPEILKSLGIERVDGILIDLGVSSHQIDTPSRGFSFKTDGILDMRMDQSQSLTAKELVNNLSEEELKKIFWEFGEEEFAGKIANKIVQERQKASIETTQKLNEIVESCLPKKVVFSRGGASKKVFQALRIAVNGELENLKETLENLIEMLNSGGRICVISFHSLEDRIVKTVFKEKSLGCVCPPSFPKCVCNHIPSIKVITKKPIVASEKELEINSRSSSAKLRIAEKI